MKELAFLRLEKTCYRITEVRTMVDICEEATGTAKILLPCGESLKFCDEVAERAPELQFTTTTEYGQSRLSRPHLHRTTSKPQTPNTTTSPTQQQHPPHTVSISEL